MPKTFAQVVADQRRGHFSDKAGEAFAGLVKQVAATGKKGRFVVVLDLVPNPNTGHLVIQDEIKVTPPKIDRAADAMFATDDGTLQRSDPKQPDLPGIRAVDTPKPEVIYVPVDRVTGEVIGDKPAAPVATVAQPTLESVAIALQTPQAAPVNLAPSQGQHIPPANEAAA